jgi:hypothetical protein
MSKPIFAVAAILLAGCASTGGWRTLSIDGSSETEFSESLTRLNTELPTTRSKIFALALVDIVSTREDSAYSMQQLRAELDGLTYDDVIALADQDGPPIKTVYYSGSWARAEKDVRRQFAYVLSQQNRAAQQASQRQQAGNWTPGESNSFR